METQTRLSHHNKFISAENIIATLAILISTEQFNSVLVLGSSGENVNRFGTFLSTVLEIYILNSKPNE